MIYILAILAILAFWGYIYVYVMISYRGWYICCAPHFWLGFVIDWFSDLWVSIVMCVPQSPGTSSFPIAPTCAAPEWGRKLGHSRLTLYTHSWNHSVGIRYKIYKIYKSINNAIKASMKRWSLWTWDFWKMWDF